MTLPPSPKLEGELDQIRELNAFYEQHEFNLPEALNVEWADIDMTRKVIDNWNHKTQKPVFVPVSNKLHKVLTRLQGQPQPFQSMDKALKNLRSAWTFAASPG